jgi:predicted metal-dependent phosphoesterase TrpH
MMGDRVRLIATLVCLLGLAVGSLAARHTERKPVQSGEFWILAGDFHVHAFPGDGSLTPIALRAEAVNEGLDVIAITNHNQAATGRLAEWIGKKTDGPILISGEEITNPDYHLIAVGVTRAVRADRTAVEAMAEIHAQGGVAIAAHPTPAFRGYDDAAFAVVDGTEAAHPSSRQEERHQFVESFERARRLHPTVAPIGSSDIHIAPRLGACRTFVFARERSVKGVLDAIRAGRTIAMDASGSLFGDADLIARVQRAGAMRPFVTHTIWQRVSLLLTWLGLAGVLLFGGKELFSTTGV